tara:strand:+ start:3198 stop:3521 length:324 start_codon:yes stop_codon:yes gene_type:complete
MDNDICPCGCNGRIRKHDDRGYGPWPCPVCDDDSDTNLGKSCTVCRNKELEGGYASFMNLFDFIQIAFIIGLGYLIAALVQTLFRWNARRMLKGDFPHLFKDEENGD